MRSLLFGLLTVMLTSVINDSYAQSGYATAKCCISVINNNACLWGAYAYHYCVGGQWKPSFVKKEDVKATCPAFTKESCSNAPAIKNMGNWPQSLKQKCVSCYSWVLGPGLCIEWDYGEDTLKRKGCEVLVNNWKLRIFP